MSDHPIRTAVLPSGLPDVDAASAEHGKKVAHHLHQLILDSPERQLPFDVWMEHALYAPGLGYYAAGSTKLGTDFTTAPELTPLFGLTLARQVADILHACQGSPAILEFGAGTGALAEGILQGLGEHGLHPPYFIIEVSPDLKHRQQQRLATYADQVQWLDRLPDHFTGCVLANEVLDAMPVKLFRFGPATTGTSEEATPAPLLECMVGLSSDHQFVWQTRPSGSALQAAMADRMPPLPGYQSEINLRAEAWIREMGAWLDEGAALLIDYGFPRHEYYHPQRSQGTLMCHFRHHGHAEPLVLPGLQDITAHVDFTAMADAALAGGLTVLGYTSQAHFLINAGIMDVLAAAQASPRDLSAIHKLLSEAEMGELFKVMAIGTDLNMDWPLQGFSRHDRRHRL